MPCVVDAAAACAVEIGIMVRDPEAMLAFYRDVLGFSPHGNIIIPVGHVWGLRLGDAIVKLVYDRTVPERHNPREQATGIRYLTLRIRNVAEVYRRGLAAGHGVRKALSRFEKADGSGGADFAILYDPDGNWIEIVEGSVWSPLEGDFSAALGSARSA